MVRLFQPTCGTLITPRALPVDGSGVPAPSCGCGGRLGCSASQAIARAREQAQAGTVGCFLAAGKQPLEPETDAEQGASRRDAGANRRRPAAIERDRGAEVADAWHDDRGRAFEIGRQRRVVQLGADGGERLAHRREVAGLVVDEGNHSSPLVLGSIRASRLSLAQATRSARANALNTAST